MSSDALSGDPCTLVYSGFRHFLRGVNWQKLGSGGGLAETKELGRQDRGELAVLVKRAGASGGGEWIGHTTDNRKM